MKASTKQLLNFALIVFTLGLVLFIGLRGNDVQDIVSALSAFSPVWIAACAAGWFGYMLCEAWGLHYFLRRQQHPISFAKSIKVTITGLYYSNVTPGATGGQPMQVYELKKDGVPIGISSSALTVKFFCFQLMLLVVGIVLWATHPAFVGRQLSGTKWILITGYIFNSFSVALVLLLAINRRIVRFLIVLFVRVGTRMKLCRDPDLAIARWEGNLDTFHASVMMIRHRPGELVMQLFISTISLFCYASVVVFIYAGFGLSGASPLELIAMAILLHISAAYTPLPGASGAQEGGFALFFQGLFPEASLFMALLIWRFCTYYISLFIGAGSTIVQSIRSMTRSRKHSPKEGAPDAEAGDPPPEEAAPAQRGEPEPDDGDDRAADAEDDRRALEPTAPTDVG